MKYAQQHATTQYAYTASGQVRRITHPEDEHSDFWYTPAGHLTQYSNDQSQITAYIKVDVLFPFFTLQITSQT